jgi:hypothetical protein
MIDGTGQFLISQQYILILPISYTTSTYGIIQVRTLSVLVAKDAWDYHEASFLYLHHYFTLIFMTRYIIIRLVCLLMCFSEYFLFLILQSVIRQVKIGFFF